MTGHLPSEAGEEEETSKSECPAAIWTAATGTAFRIDDGVVVITVFQEIMGRPWQPRRRRDIADRGNYLNVQKDAVSRWERGEKRPDGPSLELLNLVKARGLRAIA